MRVWTILCFALLAAGCAERGERLRLLNWSDYMPAEVLAEFERRTGVAVVEDTYDSPEAMLAKLRATGGGDYDVLITPDYTVGSLARAGLIRPLERERLPHFAGLDARFQDPGYDPGARHSVAYQWGTTGLAYREDLVRGPVASWGVLFDPAQAVGDFLLLDEMREQIGAALRYAGHSVNSVDPAHLERARTLLLDAKVRSRGFAGGTAIRDRLLAGDVAVAPAYSGDILAARAEEPRLRYVIPREGATLWADCLVILAASPRSELAHRFIDFLLEPEIAARIANAIGYATPVAAALPWVEARDDPLVYPPPEMRARLEMLADLGEAEEAMRRLWAEVRSR
ncbi:MAG: spermidine/putrescine ABC transporter substrate-binding protein [Porticoccaceae bacterium]|nr:MAG: spermidine/putrescine ABC transporter substrate-binding protein [Porticoccaceae bacterium]